MPKALWWVAPVLALVQVTSLALAYLSGVRARFFSAASADLMSLHEEAAINFLWQWVVLTVLILLAVVLVRWRRVTILHLIVLIVLGVQLWEAIQLGHAGGRLLH